MIVKLLTEHHLEFLNFKGGCTGSSDSTLAKMPHCWKSHTYFSVGDPIAYVCLIIHHKVVFYSTRKLILFFSCSLKKINLYCPAIQMSPENLVIVLIHIKSHA